MMLSGADIIVKVLIEQGVETVFGYPGGQILHVYDSLFKYKKHIKHVLTSHEQGAVHSADGFARASGKVGVCMATSGPGATNLVTGIATAFLDSIPLVAICGNVMTSQIGTDSFQEIDITGITLPITKHNFFVSDVNDLAGVLRQAFKLATSGRRGPVLVDVPKDVQIAKCEFEETSVVTPYENFPAKDERIFQTAQLINSSSKPFIYFGGGLISSQAQSQMLELAEKIDAPIGCSLMGLSAIPTDNERFLGMQGMHGHYASTMAMACADLIIALGVRFNDRVTGNRRKFAKNVKVVHIDLDGSELSKTVDAVVGLRGDIKLTLEKLLPLIDASKKTEWTNTVEKFKRDEIDLTDNRAGLTPKNVIGVLNEFLDENTPVVTDVGQHQMWTAQFVNLKKSRRFISSGGLGTMGFGLGGAIGAYFATGEKPVLVTGDGSFAMSLNELATCVTYNVPVVILLFNNGVLGMVRQMQTLFLNKRYSNTSLDRKTDFIKLCDAFGLKGEKVDDLDGLADAFSRAFKSKTAYLIDCAIDKDEFVLPTLPAGGSFDDIIVKIDN